MGEAAGCEVPPQYIEEFVAEVETLNVFMTVELMHLVICVLMCMSVCIYVELLK